MGAMEIFVADASVGPDAIGWAGAAAGVPHDPTLCIHPPPFGTQCTVHRHAAIAACLALPRCIALTCPDPRESHIGTRGIAGPICQARSRAVAAERGHGMCKPGGCMNVALRKEQVPLTVEQRALLDGPARIGVLLRGASAGADLVRHLRAVGSPPLYIIRGKRQRQRRWLAQVDDASYARRMRFSFNGTRSTLDVRL